MFCFRFFFSPTKRLRRGLGLSKMEYRSHKDQKYGVGPAEIRKVGGVGGVGGWSRDIFCFPFSFPPPPALEREVASASIFSLERIFPSPFLSVFPSFGWSIW